MLKNPDFYPKMGIFRHFYPQKVGKKVGKNMIFLPTFGSQTWPFAHFFWAKCRFSLPFRVRILLIFETKVGKAQKSGHKSGQKFSLPSIFSLPFEDVFTDFPYLLCVRTRLYLGCNTALSRFSLPFTTRNRPHPAQSRRIHRHIPPRQSSVILFAAFFHRLNVFFQVFHRRI